ncbi:MAG: hypothetical protein ACR2PT_16970 [Endozoicomonas sp.]
MNKRRLPFILAVAASSTMALASGTPSAPCYVNGNLIATNMQVSVCQYQHDGDPMMKYSYDAGKKGKKTMDRKTSQ